MILQQENEADEFRVSLQALKTQDQNKALVGNSAINQYQKKLEDHRDFVKKEEEITLYHEDKKKGVSRQWSEVSQGIRNLFIRCQATMKVKSLSFTNISSNKSFIETLFAYLEVIKARILDLSEMMEEFRAEQQAMPSGVEDKTTVSQSNALVGEHGGSTTIRSSTNITREAFGKN